MICKRIFWETFELIQKWFAVRRPQTIAKFKILKEKSYKFSQNLQVGEGLANLEGVVAVDYPFYCFLLRKIVQIKELALKLSKT